MAIVQYLIYSLNVNICNNIKYQRSKSKYLSKYLSQDCFIAFYFVSDTSSANIEIVLKTLTLLVSGIFFSDILLYVLFVCTQCPKNFSTMCSYFHRKSTSWYKGKNVSCLKYWRFIIFLSTIMKVWLQIAWALFIRIWEMSLVLFLAAKPAEIFEKE